MNDSISEKGKKPSLMLAVLPVIILICIISIGVHLFGDNITSGPSQIALLFSSVVTAIIAMGYLKIPWSKLEEGMLDHLSKTGSAVFILLMIGALTATWMLSGVVPTMIYYGLKIIHPSIFLLIAFLLSGIVSVMAGSSWTTIGTIGVAMLSAGEIIGIPVGWLAGSVISGAYFGDKISPLSDTTNLSASVAGVDLYKHVKYMLITTIPAFILSVIIFTIAGFALPIETNLNINANLVELENSFNISGWLLLIPCFTIFLIFKKVSPFITLFCSALLGAIVAYFAQPQIVSQIYEGISGGFNTFLYSILTMISSPVEIETGYEMVNSLASTNGMSGMLNTIWLILCVVTFGGVMEASGLINVITQRMIRFMNNTVSLVSSTIATCVFCNLTLSDQYMAVLLPGKMFADTYRKGGYPPELLSRTLQDSGTVTSVLVPWNTCGIVQATVLGVPTLAYLPYCFFNIMTPIISIIIAATGYKIKRLVEVEKVPNN